jgi:EmrB/QacA subfamily drug resistance transporter
MSAPDTDQDPRSEESEASEASTRTTERIILALACIGQFMVVLDVSVVNVALPSIGRDLHYSPTGLQWVVNAYVLTFAGFLLLGGRAADLFGRRRVYLSGLALFSLASLIGGFAQNADWLTTARAVQGIGGAIMSPATLTIIVTTFSGVRLAHALGLWSAVAGAGGAAGSLLGGVLTAEASWRWVLFINVPIGVVVIALGLRYLAELRKPDQTLKLDILGAIAVTASLGAFIFAVVGTDVHAWGSAATLWPLGIAVVLMIAFAVIEAKVATTPLVPFRLFKSWSLTSANVIMLLIGAAFFSMWYFLSLYLQNVLGFGPLRAGLAFFPMAATIIIGSQVSSRLLPRIGSRPLTLAGTIMASGGFAWLSQIPADGDYWQHVFVPSCIIALALGFLFTPMAASATAGVSPSEAGLASGVLNTSRQLGGSLGLAILATIATDHSRNLLANGHPSSLALSSGYGRAFAVAATICLVAFAIAIVAPNIGRIRPEPAVSEDGARAEHVEAVSGTAGALDPELA